MQDKCVFTMSRWHDRSPDGLVRWANLRLPERVADRMADILLAAHETHEMIELEGPANLERVSRVMNQIYAQVNSLLARLPPPRNIPARDPELAAVLERIARALSEICSLRGRAYDEALSWVERLAAPEALSLFHEIERLDVLLGGSTRPSAELIWDESEPVDRSLCCVRSLYDVTSKLRRHAISCSV